MLSIVKAYAKINLALNVNERLENGYHNVDMVSIPLELHDVLEIEALPHGYETYITTDDENLPTDESNLSYKAYIKLREETKLKDNYMIHIHKRIPMCAGLGGGSSDAAAVINTVLKNSKIKISDQEKIRIGSKIGGDVAFCLFNKPARCRGIGEELDFFEMKHKYAVLLIKPHEGVSTAQAYNDFDKLEVKPVQSNIDLLIDALKNGNDEIIAQEMKNGLQECAIKLVPEIQDIIQTLKNDGFNMVMMSGSGSTVFALSKNPYALMKESKKFDKNKYRIVLTSTL